MDIHASIDIAFMSILNIIYDLISKSETGKVLTKIAREGRHGRESSNRILMPHAHQTSDAGRVVSQSEMFPSYN